MKKVTHYFSAVYQKADSLYLGWVQELPGVNTQGKTLAETKANLREALQLVLEANKMFSEPEDGHDVLREPVAISY